MLDKFEKNLIEANKDQASTIPVEIANLLANYNYNLGKLSAFKWAWLVAKDELLRHSLRVRADVTRTNLTNLKKELNNALNKTKYEIR